MRHRHNPHTTTVYHPNNANHSLRIPEAARAAFPTIADIVAHRVIRR